jgi:hypothetical protein
MGAAPFLNKAVLTQLQHLYFISAELVGGNTDTELARNVGGAYEADRT